MTTDYIGYWTCDAPLTPEEVAEDRPILDALKLPEEMAICRMEVFVHGRLYEWERIEARTL